MSIIGPRPLLVSYLPYNLVSKRERRLCIAQSDGKFGS